jgi:CheY-like chemotaxis protein
MFQSPDSAREESQKLRVLVVDDEPTLRLGFAYALTNRDTTVETAATGIHALERLAGMNFDVMVLDLRMPDLDGIGVIEALRRQGNNIPIILCSAVLNPKAALSAIRHGVVDFLLKPVRPMDLRQAISFVVRPERDALPLALQAARVGNAAEAICILEAAIDPTEQGLYWLKIFKSIRDSDANEDGSSLEEEVRTGLTILAFNAPSVR